MQVPVVGSGMVRVGVLLPLSGPYKETGKSFLEAIQLALFEQKPENIELFIEDTHGDAAQTVTGFRQLIQRGVDIILGPIFTNEIKDLNYFSFPVPIISFSNNISYMRENFYIFGYNPWQQAEQLLNYVHIKNPGNIALIVSPGSFGDYMTKFVAEKNLNIALYTFEKDHQQQQSLFRKIQRLGYPNIWVPEGGLAGISIVGQMRFTLPEATFQLLGSDAWEDALIIKDPSYRGGWYAGPYSNQRQMFTSQYSKAYGHVPSRLASMAYDAMSLVIALNTRGFASEILTAPSGFKGVDGYFRLFPNGSVERSFSILEMRGGGKIKVLQASQPFI